MYKILGQYKFCRLKHPLILDSISSSSSLACSAHIQHRKACTWTNRIDEINVSSKVNTLTCLVNVDHGDIWPISPQVGFIFREWCVTQMELGEHFSRFVTSNRTSTNQWNHCSPFYSTFTVILFFHSFLFHFD